MTDMDIDIERLRELAEKAIAINSDTMLLDPRTVSALVEELEAARQHLQEWASHAVIYHTRCEGCLPHMVPYAGQHE